MKKLILPFSFILLLASCSGEANNENNDTVAPSTPLLTACECADIYAKNPTIKPKNREESRKELAEKWNKMWAPCEGIDMSEVLKCK